MTESIYTVRMTCSSCGTELNRTEPRTAEDILRRWAMIVMTSAFGSGRCPTCATSTFSDCNIHTDLHVYRNDERIEFDELKADAKQCALAAVTKVAQTVMAEPCQP